MIWLNTFVYFVFYSILLLIGSFLYGQALLFFVKRKSIFKNFFIFLTYIFFIILIVYPIILIFDLIKDFHFYISKNNYFLFFVLSCFILSIIPMLILFRIKYLKRLQLFGLFKN
ncbi:hypothetical protein DT74_21490 [Acinetobacter sp. ETR1]|nr:hypothetical protein DT74_21490 [Acinetobacter sp. ETR1]